MVFPMTNVFSGVGSTTKQLAQPPTSYIQDKLPVMSYIGLLVTSIIIVITIIIINNNNYYYYIYISLHLLTVPTRPHSPHEGHRAPRMGPSCDLYACGRTDTSNSNSYNHRDKSRKLIYKPYCKTMVIWVWINTY